MGNMEGDYLKYNKRRQQQDKIKEHADSK